MKGMTTRRGKKDSLSKKGGGPVFFLQGEGETTTFLELEEGKRRSFLLSRGRNRFRARSHHGPERGKKKYDLSEGECVSFNSESRKRDRAR